MSKLDMEHANECMYMIAHVAWLVQVIKHVKHALPTCSRVNFWSKFTPKSPTPAEKIQPETTSWHQAPLMSDAFAPLWR